MLTFDACAWKRFKSPQTTEKRQQMRLWIRRRIAPRKVSAARPLIAGLVGLRLGPVPDFFQHLDRFQDLGIAVQFVEH
jgi:hypothetical protein